jgi:hypothetical protein
MKFRTTVMAAALLGLTATGLPVSAASANGGDEVRRRGSCSGSADWRLRARPDDGRIEVEARVESGHSGRTWHWRILHDGGVSSRGTATTSGSSGSFEVRRRLVNLSGPDQIGFRAKNRHSGQVCRGSLTM